MDGTYQGIGVVVADRVVTLRENNSTEILNALDCAIKRAGDPDLIVLTTAQAIEYAVAMNEREAAEDAMREQTEQDPQVND